MESIDSRIRGILHRGVVIPASPLALNAARRLDERRQRAIYRYYVDAGAGGVAVGVHTTQFQIRDKQIGLLKPVLALAAEEMERADARLAQPLVRIAGICGKTTQATAEAELARELGYHTGLLSLGAMKDVDEDELIDHATTLSRIIPIIGFYLQRAVGGRVLSYRFWRRLAEVENVIAVKIAPFNRYQTLDVVRAIAESGRTDISLYTGNDDSIVMDLLTPFRFQVNGKVVERKIVGGLLGHWAVWTRRAVELLGACHDAIRDGTEAGLLARSIEVTDANAALFDAANAFAGCIAGLHEVLRRQGLFEGIWCLDLNEVLSPGQLEEIDRVYKAYPHLNDDGFVAQHRDRWLQG